MGVDQNFLIGPFAKCRDAGMPNTGIVRFCSNDGSHKVEQGKSFCSTCGKGITEQPQTFPGLTASVNAWDIADECKERITHVSGMCEFGEKLTDYWISNLTNDGIWSLALEMYTDALQEISPEVITEGKAKFTEFFAPELEILRKHYASVEICWGVLGWCS